MSIEFEIMSYLYTYGNTRESDLVEYGTRNLDQSSKAMKGILDKMTAEGKILRLIHNKLGPKAVYLTLGDLPTETLVDLEIERVGIRDRDKRSRKEIHEDILRILKEAENVAEKRITKKFPDSKK